MKKLQSISTLTIIFLLVSCAPTNMLREESPVLEMLVYDALEEINITDTLSFKKEWEQEFDNGTGMVFSANYKKAHFDVMIDLDPEGTEYKVIAIGDFGDLSVLDKIEDPDFPHEEFFSNLYWVHEDMRPFHNIYNWETNELISTSQDAKEILENKPAEGKIGQDEIETTKKIVIPDEYKAMFNKDYAELSRSEKAFIAAMEIFAHGIAGEDQIEEYLEKDDYERYGKDIYRLIIEKTLYEIDPVAYEEMGNEYIRAEEGVFIHEDENISIYYLGLRTEQDNDYITFHINNKTDAELTFRTTTFGIDGKYLRFEGGESIDGLSNSTIQFFRMKTEERLPTTTPDKISGTIRVIDFSNSAINKPYDVTFSNVELGAND